MPLPWSADGPSFGFGTGGAHLPQPAWVADYAVSVQHDDSTSSLALYRAALAMRRLLQTDESLTWVETGRDDVLAFRRSNGWTVFTNFGTEPFELPDGPPISLSSRHRDERILAGETTVWFAGA